MNLEGACSGSLIGIIIKKWPWASDLVMTQLMKQGLLVQNGYYTSAQSPLTEKFPFTKKYYNRTLPKASEKVGRYKVENIKIKEKGTPENIVSDIFSRKGELKPEMNNNSCLLFPWFAQWFVEEFFKTGEDFDPDIQYKDKECSKTWSDHQVDLTSVYGANSKPERTAVLRNNKGYLRCQRLKGDDGKEMYPLYYGQLTEKEKIDCPMQYPKDLPEEKINKLFVLGHPRQDLHPGQMLMTTIFLREHNRICKRLRKEYPDKKKLNDNGDWFFNTSRKILNGILLQLVLSDYVEHINPAKGLFKVFFKPSLLKKIPDWESTIDTHRMGQEFNLLYRWHPLVPDTVVDIDDKVTDLKDTFYSTEYLTKRGTANVVKAAVSQRASAFGPKCSPAEIYYVDVSGVRQAREFMNLRSFNSYCTRYYVDKVDTFEQFNEDIVTELENFYETANDIEFFVGVINQKTESGIFPPLLIRMVLAHAVHGIFSHPLCQNGDWTKTTFDEKGIGFEITENTNFMKLVARNTGLSEEEVSFEYIPK